MKKYFDIYKPEKWERNKEREKKYTNEKNPMYWDYVNIQEEIMKHPRIIKIIKSN